MALVMDLWVCILYMWVWVLDYDASLILEELIELLVGVMVLGWRNCYSLVRAFGFF